MSFHTLLDSNKSYKTNFRDGLPTLDDGLAYFQSELANVDPTLYTTKYSNIVFNELCPIKSVAEWADSYDYYSFDSFLVGKFIGANAKDTPLVEIERSRHSEPLFYGSASFRYSLDELRKSAKLGFGLTTEFQQQVIRAYQEHMQQVCFNGDAERGVTGLFNNANVTIKTADSDFSTDAAAARIFVQNLVSDIFNQSKQVHLPNVILLPSEIWTLLSNTPSIVVANGAAYQSELEFLKRNNTYTNVTGQEIAIKPIVQLNNASAAGGYRVIAYELNAENLCQTSAIPVRFLPPQPQNNSIFVPSEYKFGAVSVRYPMAFMYGDNHS